MSILDTYNLRARVAPVFVVSIPAIFAIAACAPQALSLKLGSAATAVSIGLSMFVTQFGRNFGKRKEAALWESWGGPPTTQLMRHRNSQFNPVLRSRYHAHLQRLCQNIRIPTAEEEARDPNSADQIYSALTRFLIGATRDTKRFPLVFKENINYGFLRNLWGLKPFGLVISVLGASTCTFRLWIVYLDVRLILPASVVGLLISFALLLALAGTP